MRDDVERAITHTKYAKVARLMGYSVQGLLELCESAMVPEGSWTTIGVTRHGGMVEGEPGPFRVAAMIAPGTSRYVFSVGPNAFALTHDARMAAKAREEIAQAIVDRIRDRRDKETRMAIASAQRSIAREQAEKAQMAEVASSPETMIIWPVAPRDHREV